MIDEGIAFRAQSPPSKSFEHLMTKRAAKAGVGYTLANILIRGIGFLTLPIFSRVLDTYDFGIYNVFIAYDAMLFCVIGFALHSSIRSANWEFPGKVDDYVSSLSLIYLINMVFLLVLAIEFSEPISALIGLDGVVIVCLVVHSCGSALVTLYNARVSLQYSYKKYMVVAAASSIGNVALSLLLIFTLFHGARYLGRIVGATIALAVVGIAMLIVFWHRVTPKPSRSYWAFGMKYSLPIVAHGLSQVALAQIGRLMTNYMVSTVSAGIYGLAANLSTIFAVLADSVGTVWTTWFYETMEGEEAGNATAIKRLSPEENAARGRVVRKRADQLSALFAVVTIVLMAIVPELIWVLGGDAYMEGAYCAFGVVLSGYCVILYNLVCVGEYYKQKTHYIMIGTILAALANIALNFWGISTFGYIAAAYTTFVAYMLYVAFHWRISRKLMGFSILSLSRTAELLCGLIALALADVFFINNVGIRIALGVMAACVVGVPLVRGSGGMRGVCGLLKGEE